MKLRDYLALPASERPAVWCCGLPVIGVIDGGAIRSIYRTASPEYWIITDTVDLTIARGATLDTELKTDREGL